MKLAYLADGSLDCPLLRLDDFTPLEAGRLRAALSAPASGKTDRVVVHQLPFVEPVGDCRLVLMCQSWDQAVIRAAGPYSFKCGLTSARWHSIVGLIDPFVTGGAGFQRAIRIAG
jgi:hypothetical protein